MADRVPPVLPQSGDVRSPSDWAQHYSELFPGMSPPANAEKPAYTGPPSVLLTPKEQAAGGEQASPWWDRLKSELEVYGFLFLLAGIGLYGLFAPQVNVAVQKAAKAL